MCLLCFYRFSELSEAVLGDFLFNGRCDGISRTNTNSHITLWLPVFKQFVDKITSWNLTSVLTSYGETNSSFAEWNESSEASEAKDSSES